MPQRFFITGATGFIGSHLAEACVAKGMTVRTIARPASDAALLDRLGVTVHRGDLTDAGLLRQALDEADVVVHCAAKVGDRGGPDEYRPVNVEALRTLLEACRGRPLHRFVHVSSLGVYEARHHHGTDESEPLPTTHWDGYTQTKMEADLLAQDYARQGLPVVVLRPGFVYGPRDRVVLPRIIQRLEVGKMNFLGGDRRALNCIYVGNLVDAVFLAVEQPRAVSQVYNLTDDEMVSRQRFVDAVADGMGYPRARQILPRWLAELVARGLRWQIRRAGPAGKPILPPARYKFLLLNLDFSIEKAKRELGYRPRVGFDDAMRETMAWYKQNGNTRKHDIAVP
jgi:nucleoside-diphosphate-sugar epimerase